MKITSRQIKFVSRFQGWGIVGIVAGFCILCHTSFAQAIPPEPGFQTPLQKTIQLRLSGKVLKQTILGALAYLEDRQIRPRPGKQSCEYDSSSEGDG